MRPPDHCAITLAMRIDRQPIRLTLFAPDGRMGRAIAEAVAADPGFALDPDHGDVLIDFSSPAALGKSLDRATAAHIPILVGTTGLDDLAERRIAAAAVEVAVLRAANTSLGVALLADLVERAARVLGPDEWDIEIVEAHHAAKVDVPSGTALMLGDTAARARGGAKLEEFNRSSCIPRQIGAIGYSAVRGGTVAGDHDVLLLGPGERLILSHRAESRAIFAAGALAAARFLHGKPPGLYTMRDVIGAP